MRINETGRVFDWSFFWKSLYQCSFCLLFAAMFLYMIFGIEVAFLGWLITLIYGGMLLFVLYLAGSILKRWWKYK